MKPRDKNFNLSPQAPNNSCQNLLCLRIYRTHLISHIYTLLATYLKRPKHIFPLNLIEIHRHHRSKKKPERCLERKELENWVENEFFIYCSRALFRTTIFSRHVNDFYSNVHANNSWRIFVSINASEFSSFSVHRWLWKFFRAIEDLL